MEDYVAVSTRDSSRWRRSWSGHLMSDETGQFPLRSLNAWEREVVQAELDATDYGRAGTATRPDSAVDSLGVAYRERGRQLAVDAPGLRVLQRGRRQDRARRSSTRTATTSRTR